MLTFNAEKHQYFWHGERVPGVSEILKETGQAKDWSLIDPFYRDRGVAVHKAVELFITGRLDEDSIDPVILPYCNQFKAWVQTQPMFGGLLLTESPMYSETRNFAGTIDLIANGTIWDIKCSKRLEKVAKWQYECQGAGYRTLFKEKWGKDFPFKILLLTGEGDAQVVEPASRYEVWEHVMGLYDEKMGRVRDTTQVQRDTDRS